MLVSLSKVPAPEREGSVSMSSPGRPIPGGRTLRIHEEDGDLVAVGQHAEEWPRPHPDACSLTLLATSPGESRKGLLAGAQPVVHGVAGDIRVSQVAEEEIQEKGLP